VSYHVRTQPNSKASLIHEHGEGDVGLFDLSRLGEHPVEAAERERVVPVELAEELGDLVDGLCGENVADEVADEEVGRGSVFDLAGCTFGRVALR
jgi:hypothetical protein